MRRPRSPEEADAPETIIGSAVVTLKDATSKLNVRAEATSGSDCIASLQNGEVVGVYGSAAGWTHIRTQSGVEGYVASTYLTKQAVEAPTQAPAEEPAEAADAPAERPAPKPAGEAELKYSYERDANGALVLDESGNPIAIVPEGMTERPTRYQRDENGDPIVVATVPVDAEIVSKEEDDQNCVVTIYVSGGGEDIALGREVTLIAILEGFDGVDYTLQWENSEDGVNWNAVEGGNAARYTYMLTEEVNNYYWRMAVMTEEAEEQSPAPHAEGENDAAGATAEDAAV